MWWFWRWYWREFISIHCISTLIDFCLYIAVDKLFQNHFSWLLFFPHTNFLSEPVCFSTRPNGLQHCTNYIKMNVPRRCLQKIKPDLSVICFQEQSETQNQYLEYDICTISCSWLNWSIYWAGEQISEIVQKATVKANDQNFESKAPIINEVSNDNLPRKAMQLLT